MPESWPCRRRSPRRSGTATWCTARPVSPTCCTSTCTSSTRSPRPRPSTASGCTGAPSAVRTSRSRRWTTTSPPPTSTSRSPTRSPASRSRPSSRNCEEFGIRLYPMGDPGTGIVHVIGPEQGLTLPGMTIVCGDSHTSTHGAFGALAFGIGTSEVEHVLATQTLPQATPEVAGDHRRRRPPGRGDRQGHRPHDHRPDRYRRWRGLGHRVPGLGHPGPVDGRPDDDLQHVDRSRRPSRDDRSRRHHVRLPRGAALRPVGASSGKPRSTTGARCPPTTARCSTRSSSSTPRRCGRR